MKKKKITRCSIIYGRGPVDGQKNKIAPSAFIARKNAVDGWCLYFSSPLCRVLLYWDSARIVSVFLTQNARVSLLNGFAFYASYDVCTVLLLLLWLLRIYGVNIHTFAHVQIRFNARIHSHRSREYLVRLLYVRGRGVAFSML